MPLRKLVPVLVLLCSVGIAAVAAGALLEGALSIDTHGWERVMAILVRDVGIALLTAVALATTIERLLLQDAIRDVARAALGYLLPQELKEELIWIFDQKLLCTDHLAVYDLQFDGEGIRMHADVRRTIKNISSHAQSIPTTFILDDLCIPNKPRSKILEYTYELGKRAPVHLEAKVQPKADEPVSHELRIEGEKLTLPVDGSVTFTARSEISRYANDRCVLLNMSATRDPRILLHVPEELNCELEFEHRNATQSHPKRNRFLRKKAPEEHAKQGFVLYELHGTLLPRQGVSLRWWPRSKLAAAPNGKVEATTAALEPIAHGSPT